MGLAIGRSVRPDERRDTYIKPLEDLNAELIGKELETKGNDIDILLCPAHKDGLLALYDRNERFNNESRTGRRMILHEGRVIKLIKELLEKNKIKYEFSLGDKKNGTRYAVPPEEYRDRYPKITKEEHMDYFTPNFIIYFPNCRPIHISLEETIGGSEKMKQEFMDPVHRPFAVLFWNSYQAVRKFPEAIQEHQEAKVERFDQYNLEQKLARFTRQKKQNYQKKVKNTIRQRQREKDEKERHELLGKKVQQQRQDTKLIDKRLKELAELYKSITSYSQYFHIEHIMNPQAYFESLL